MTLYTVILVHNSGNGNSGTTLHRQCAPRSVLDEVVKIIAQHNRSNNTVPEYICHWPGRLACFEFYGSRSSGNLTNCRHSYIELLLFRFRRFILFRILLYRSKHIKIGVFKDFIYYFKF